MVNRVSRDVVCLIRTSTSGVDLPDWDGASDSLLLREFKINPLNQQRVDYNPLSADLQKGASLVGSDNTSFSITTDLWVGATTGDRPPVDDLLRIGGWAYSAGTTPTRAEYRRALTAGNIPPAVIRGEDSGVQHVAVGCKAKLKFGWKLDSVPSLMADVTGVFVSAAAATNTVIDLSRFLRPKAIVNANILKGITLGCTYSAGSINGGTQYPSTGMEIDGGENVVHDALLGGEDVIITERNMTATLELRVTAAQEAALINQSRAGTLTTIGFEIEVDTGRKIVFYGGGVNLLSPDKTDRNGRRMGSIQIEITGETILCFI